VEKKKKCQADIIPRGLERAKGASETTAPSRRSRGGNVLDFDLRPPREEENCAGQRGDGEGYRDGQVDRRAVSTLPNHLYSGTEKERSCARWEKPQGSRSDRKKKKRAQGSPDSSRSPRGQETITYFSKKNGGLTREKKIDPDGRALVRKGRRGRKARVTGKTDSGNDGRIVGGRRKRSRGRRRSLWIALGVAKS